MDSQEPLKTNESLVSSSEARKVAPPSVPEPGKEARQETEVFGHAERTQKNEQGLLGRFFGSRNEKPGNIAALVIIFCFTLLAIAFFKLLGATDAPQAVAPAIREPSYLPDSFFKLLSALLGVTGLALGYLFGSSDKDKRP